MRGVQKLRPKCKTEGCERLVAPSRRNKNNNVLYWRNYCYVCGSSRLSYTSKNKEWARRRRYNQRSRQKKKQKIFEHYGNSCVRCGYNDIRALTVHHINHNGGEERKKGIRFYQLLGKIIKNGFPDDYEVLCRNCNWLEHLDFRGLL